MEFYTYIIHAGAGEICSLSLCWIEFSSIKLFSGHIPELSPEHITCITAVSQPLCIWNLYETFPKIQPFLLKNMRIYNLVQKLCIFVPALAPRQTTELMRHEQHSWNNTNTRHNAAEIKKRNKKSNIHLHNSFIDSVQILGTILLK